MSAAAARYYQSLVAGNAVAVCDSLSAAGRQQLIADLQPLGGARNCVDAARKAHEVLTAYLGPAVFDRLEGGKPTSIKVTGESATATVRFVGGPKDQFVQLVKEPKGWKVNEASGAAHGARGATVLPDLPGDQRPRVEGRWRVVYVGGPDDPTRTTWRVKPRCDLGACGFAAKSSTKYRFRFHFDKTVGDYTLKDTTTDTCVNQTTQAVLVRKGYTDTDNWNLRATSAVLSAGQQYATEMRADRTQTAHATAAGLAQSCTDPPDGYPINEQVRLVRIQPPVGDEIKVSNSGESSGSASIGGE